MLLLLLQKIDTDTLMLSVSEQAPIAQLENWAELTLAKDSVWGQVKKKVFQPWYEAMPAYDPNDPFGTKAEAERLAAEGKANKPEAKDVPAAKPEDKPVEKPVQKPAESKPVTEEKKQEDASKNVVDNKKEEKKDGGAQVTQSASEYKKSEVYQLPDHLKGHQKGAKVTEAWGSLGV